MPALDAHRSHGPPFVMIGAVTPTATVTGELLSALLVVPISI